uniref:Uncharacterized protein n=1 Tax=Tanacetum cinerariifolium TaxID=118510 RepID=A0A6L2P6W1_TANCI|nr:hypothetical protein [Tanacetum cinerariifolium]
MEVQDAKEKLRAVGGVAAKKDLIDNAPAADDEGLSGSKKHSTLLDGPSPKDYVHAVSLFSRIFCESDGGKTYVSDLIRLGDHVLLEAKDFIEKAASNSVVDDESAPAANDEGLPGSKKCSALLDGPSPKD